MIHYCQLNECLSSGESKKSALYTIKQLFLTVGKPEMTSEKGGAGWNKHPIDSENHHFNHISLVYIWKNNYYISKFIECQNRSVYNEVIGQI